MKKIRKCRVQITFPELDGLTLKKLFRMFRLTTFIFFLSLMQAMGLDSYAQLTKISLNVENERLEKVLGTIEEESEFFFLYNKDLIDVEQEVSVHAQNETIKAILDELLKRKDIAYTVYDRQIVLSNIEVISEMDARQKTITGTVTDEMGQPLPGVTVVIKGTTNGTVTNMDGNYSISNIPKNAILVFSFVGMLSQEIAVGTMTTVNIQMKVDAIGIEEVVAIGYGTMKKKDLTGAVSSVNMEEIPALTYSSASHALAGKIAGVQINNISAQPGGQVTFNIRGAASTGAGNNPLFIIDGFPVSSQNEVSGGKYNGGPKDNILSSINPSDIVSIDVLKDASSTAIYGARAGQGVIIVTTKRGKEGNVKIKYETTFSFQKASNSFDILNSTEWRREAEKYNYDNFLKTNGITPYGSKDLSQAPNYEPRFTAQQIANPEYNTNWVNEILRDGFQQQHNLSMSGGSNKTQYYTSINYFDQKGVVKKNNMKRFAARVNIDQEISNIVKAGISLSLSKNDYDNVPIGGGQNNDASMLIAALQNPPTLPVKDDIGNYVLNPLISYLPNPVSLLEITDKSTMERLLSNAYLEVNPIQGLKLKLNLGADRQFSKRQTYNPKTTLVGKNQNGSATQSEQDKYDYLMDITANYAKTIGKHKFTILAGHSYQQFNWSGFNASNSDFLIDEFLYNNLASGAFPRPGVGSTAGKSSMASLFTRLTYNYDERYLLTATYRADGASNFSDNNKWGYFPSVALAWRISEEKFMESTKSYLSNLKLRLSLGQTGNSNIGNRAFDFYSTGRNYLIGGKSLTGVFLGQMGNKDLKWETTTEYNVGLDIGLFSKVNITAEYYQKTISDLLNWRNLMSYQEVSSIASNIGKTQSKGFELTINSINIKRSDFSWTSGFTLSLFRDRWLERDPTWKPASFENVNDFIRAQFTYRSDGLVQAGETIPYMTGAVPGTVKFKDLDGFARDNAGVILFDDNGRAIKTGKPDGRLDEADIQFVGTTDPSFMFGLNNSLTYKNFDLGFYLYGQFGKLMNGSYKDWITTEAQRFRTDYNFPSTIKDVWSSTNQNATRPGYFQSTSAYGYGDYFLEKIWFVRIRNISLGYTIPKNKINKIISSARVYIDVNNPLIFTNYDGLDPETDLWTNLAPYPNVRTYSIGLSVTF